MSTEIEILKQVVSAVAVQFLNEPITKWLDFKTSINQNEVWIDIDTIQPILGKEDGSETDLYFPCFCLGGDSYIKCYADVKDGIIVNFDLTSVDICDKGENTTCVDISDETPLIVEDMLGLTIECPEFMIEDNNGEQIQVRMVYDTDNGETYWEVEDIIDLTYICEVHKECKSYEELLDEIDEVKDFEQGRADGKW